MEGANTSLVVRLKMEVSKVLKKQEQQPCKEYDMLLHILADPKTETQTVIKYLRQLRDCISLVVKEHEHLVGVLLNINWLEKDFELIREYKPLVLNLVSAHPYYLRACVRMLIKKFFPCGKLKKEDSEKGPDKARREVDEARFIHVHELFQAVAKIVPTTRKVAMELFRENFPYHSREVYLHEVYTRNLLTAVHYMPELRLQILELIVDRMLQLDVRAPRKDIEEIDYQSDDDDKEEDDCDDDDDDDDEPAMFQMEGDEEKDCEDMETDKEKAGDTEESQTMKHAEAMRLDIMMDLTFSHIHRTCYVKGELKWEATKKLYRELLSVFDKLMFTTHASCHAQFLLFYICSFRQELLIGFLDFLWKKVQTVMTQSVFRQAAAGYLGSLLARAAYIRLNTVQETLKMMTDWLHEYLNQAGSDGLHADLAHHAPFYAVCQAVFYVFCFRSQQFLQERKGYRWAESLNFQRMVSSKLNPLKCCLPIICTKFASVTRSHQIAFCDTIMQRNNRLQFISSEPTLEAYFPFDPYLLKRSGRWLKNLYREYQDTGLEEVEERGDKDDFLPDEDDTSMSLGTSIPCTEAAKLDFLHYSISPGFKL